MHEMTSVDTTTSSTSEVSFVDYIGYENGKYESMMNGNTNALVVAVDDKYTHYISIYEFIYDEQNVDANEQCFDYLEPFELCLLINDHNERIVWIENEENDKQNS